MREEKRGGATPRGFWKWCYTGLSFTTFCAAQALLADADMRREAIAASTGIVTVEQQSAIDEVRPWAMPLA